MVYQSDITATQTDEAATNNDMHDTTRLPFLESQEPRFEGLSDSVAAVVRRSGKLSTATLLPNVSTVRRQAGSGSPPVQVGPESWRPHGTAIGACGQVDPA